MIFSKIKVCICYLLTSLLIGMFVYVLVSNNVSNKRILDRLREDIDEMSHNILHSSAASCASVGDSRQLTEIIESIVKKRLDSLWDDVYSLKKQVKQTDCLGALRKKSTAVDDERINFAAEQLGARVYSVKAEPLEGTSFVKKLFNMHFDANPPINMLRPCMQPGSCFAYRHNRSEIVLQLAREIFVNELELDHISKAASPIVNTSSAPKRFAVFGLDSHTLGQKSLLGEFEFNNNGKQLYKVGSPHKFKYLRFKFMSNHGNAVYTCIYKIAVYGRFQ